MNVAKEPAEVEGLSAVAAGIAIGGGVGSLKNLAMTSLPVTGPTLPPIYWPGPQDPPGPQPSALPEMKLLELEGAIPPAAPPPPAPIII
jgi:hypothetical protein